MEGERAPLLPADVEVVTVMLDVAVVVPNDWAAVRDQLDDECYSRLSRYGMVSKKSRQGSALCMQNRQMCGFTRGNGPEKSSMSSGYVEHNRKMCISWMLIESNR